MVYKSCMSTRFKWISEDTIQKGNKYDKIYHGKYRSERNTSVCAYVKNPKTFINYGVVLKYCPVNNEVFFTPAKPPRSEKISLEIHNKFMNSRGSRHFGDSGRHFDIRLTSAEMKIIKENKNIIDVKMLDAILNRDV